MRTCIIRDFGRHRPEGRACRFSAAPFPRPRSAREFLKKGLPDKEIDQLSLKLIRFHTQNRPCRPLFPQAAFARVRQDMSFFISEVSASGGSLIPGAFGVCGRSGFFVCFSDRVSDPGLAVRPASPAPAVPMNSPLCEFPAYEFPFREFSLLITPHHQFHQIKIIKSKI